ncbi:MAG: N-acetylglucosamine-6-phosphate deacetylase [Clostridia bacterium]|nr:N-acetylglucosamine-6-phosphate deacetylase [Clostridia bacterium]
MIIKNAEVYTEEGIFKDTDVYIKDGIFVESAEEASGDGQIIDGTRCYLIPGLTDIHFHGCVGRDFCDGTGEAISAIAEYEASQGVTTIVPATMTFSEEKLIQIAKAAKAHKNEKGAILCGINMEGPFIAMKKKGAQNGKYIHKPDIEMFDRIQKTSGGLFKLVDLAPEEEGAMEFIKAKKDEVVLSIAHTTTDYETAKAAIDAGVHHMTHLYNAMNPINHREPGPIIAASDNETCEAELICDGVHIHPAIVRNTLKMFGPDRIIFISDTMMAAGLEDGNYELGGQPVIVKGNRATLEDGTLAGSNTNLMNCMRVAVRKMQVPLETAVRCAAVNPAKSVGIYEQYGSITPGKVANAVLLKKETLETVQVILKGRQI